MWRHPGVSSPIASSLWRGGSSWRMGALPPGAGAPVARPSRLCAVCAAPSAASLTSWSTLPRPTPCGRGCGVGTRPGRHAPCPVSASRPMARRSLLHPAGRCLGRCGITWASCLASPRWSQRWGGERWPAPARAWQPPTPNGVQGARARQQPSRRPAPKSGWQRPAPRCAPRARSSANGPCTQPHGSPSGASAVDGPSDARYGPSWNRGRRDAIGAVGPRPLWPNWPNGGGGSHGSRRGVSP
jgi:hypothetical protein